MKKGLYLFLLLFLMTLGGCDKTEDGSYVKPISISEKIQGTWKLSKLTQIDEIAKANGEARSELVLTDQLGFSSFSIQLNVDADLNPSTYTVSGTAPQIITPAGFWDMDLNYTHADQSKNQIVLYSDAAKTQKLATLDVYALPGTKTELQFVVTRKLNGVPFLSYSYLLTPQTTTK